MHQQFSKTRFATLWKFLLQYYGKIFCNFREKVLAKNTLTDVFSLPIRNWNYTHPHQRRTQSSVFSLPIRNWNAFFLNDFPWWACAGFQPTYKELKREKDTFHGVIEKRFQPTYKELKLRFLEIISICFCSVFSLPIRNWNKGSIKKGEKANMSFQPTYKELKL